MMACHVMTPNTWESVASPVRSNCLEQYTKYPGRVSRGFFILRKTIFFAQTVIINLIWKSVKAIF